MELISCNFGKRESNKIMVTICFYTFQPTINDKWHYCANEKCNSIWWSIDKSQACN